MLSYICNPHELDLVRALIPLVNISFSVIDYEKAAQIHNGCFLHSIFYNQKYWTLPEIHK